MTCGYSPPPWREQVQAVLLALACAVLFVGKGVWPGWAVMPFPPEALEPLRTEALGDGRITVEQVFAGNPAFGDKYNQSLAWDRILGARLRAAELPLWTRDLAGGAPLVPQMGQVYQPWSWLLVLIPAPDIYGVWYVLHQVLFAWFAYRFLRRIGTRHAAALLGVVCVAIGLWTQARVHHNVILSAALPLFAMLSCVHELCVHRGGARTAGWLALGTGISWLGGMPQVSLMATALAAAFALALAVQQPRGARLRPLGWTAVAFGAGGLVGLAQMGPVFFARELTSRVVAPDELRGLLAVKALEWDHLLNAVWSDLLAWPAEKWYAPPLHPVRAPWAKLLLIDWSRITHDHAHNWPETAFAVGTPALALAVAGAAHRRLRFAALFFGAVAVLAFLWAAGTEPLLSLSAATPGLRDGDLKRFLFPCAMALSVLAALGLDRVLAQARAPRASLALLTAVIALSAALWAWHLAPADVVMQRFAQWTTAGAPSLRPEDFVGAVHPGEADANRERLLLTFGRTGAIALAALGLLLARGARLTAPGLIALTAVELLLAGRGTIVPVESARVTTPARILAPALAATRAAVGARPRFQRLVLQPDDRVAGSLLRPNLGAFFGLEDLASYHPLPPRRLEEVFLALEPDAPGKRSVTLEGAGVDQLRRAASLQHPLADLLGLRWVLADGPLELPGLIDRTPAGYPYRFRLYERTTCLPRATFVTRARVVADRAERLGALAVRSRDPSAEVVLEDPAAPLPAPARAAVAAAVPRIVAHGDESVEIAVSCASAGYLRLADPWDPGWTATVDGEPARVWIADHYLRAVWLEPGEHTVVFRYDGPTVAWPRRLAVLGVLAVLALLLAPAATRRWRSRGAHPT